MHKFIIKALAIFEKILYNRCSNLLTEFLMIRSLNNEDNGYNWFC